MFQRLIEQPQKSYFLLGPRGTGKSTWLRDKHFDLRLDLLSSRDLLAYKGNPSRLYDLAAPLKPGQWVLIDEVQKVPELLNEVHRLYEERRLHFALTGSSARKLKRAGVNLLAGRAINLEIFPFCYAEYAGTLDLNFRIKWGTLPLIVDNKEYLAETAESYVHNYLRQEILEEGLVRKLENFARFLPVAALYNGKPINYQLVAENCEVSRAGVTEYFDILFDTLLAFRLPAWRPRLKVKELKTPKFYFFDPGIARACLGYHNEIDRSYLGYSLENLVINEVRAYNSYYRRRADLFYYAVSNAHEVDLIISLGTQAGKQVIIAIEIKLAERWQRRWNAALLSITTNKQLAIKHRIGVYTGTERQEANGIEIYPIDRFLDDLFAGVLF